MTSDLGISKSQESSGNEITIREEINKKLSPLKRTRGVVKRKITLLIKQTIEIAKNDHQLVTAMLEEIKSQIFEVRNYDNQIEAVICASDILEYSSTMLDEEMIASTDYHLKHQKTMKMFHLSEKKPLSPFFYSFRTFTQ